MMLRLLILISIIFLSCNKEKKTGNKRFSDAGFDKSISRFEVNPDTASFEELSKDRPFVFPDSSSETSTVNYCQANDGEGHFSCSENYACRALFESDTLSIIIGNSNAFGGEGFVIRYTNGKFNTSPYRWTDVDIKDRAAPIIEIREQKLILDKKQYEPGDSLYGNIYFHALVTEQGEKTEHFGQGYFRCKIETTGK